MMSWNIALYSEGGMGEGRMNSWGSRRYRRKIQRTRGGNDSVQAKKKLFCFGTQCRNVTIMLCKKLCDDFLSASGACFLLAASRGIFANHIKSVKR